MRHPLRLELYSFAIDLGNFLASYDNLMGCSKGRVNSVNCFLYVLLLDIEEITTRKRCNKNNQLNFFF